MMTEALFRFHLVNQSRLVFFSNKLMLNMIEAFISDRCVQKRFNRIDMIKILTFFPERDKGFLDQIFHHGRIGNILIPKGRQGMEIAIENLSEGLPVSPVDIFYDVLMHPEIRILLS
jgi:hypothetical protein